MGKLTLLDEFAIAAMQGMVSTINDQEQLDRLREWANKNGMTLSEFIAMDSYKQAAAMMKEREKHVSKEEVVQNDL